MASSLFATNKVTRRLHTPTTFRAQRRLQFSTPQPNALNAALQLTAMQNSTTPQDSNVLNSTSSADSAVPATSTSTASSAVNSNFQHATHVHVPNPIVTVNTPDNRVLPWDINGNKHTKLYSAAPPNLKYPAGSRDEDANDRFVIQMDMFLNRNYLVRSVINGTTPHPFSVYDRLNDYWTALGMPNKVFNTTETFATLESIKEKGHEAFHAELIELLWFGGVVSYGNIMAEVYAIIYGWIDPDDLPEIEGLCELNDGITFRNEVIKSLHVVRVNHKQQIINNLYSKLDNVQLVMRNGGMHGFFAKLRKARLKLNKAGEMVSEAYLLRRVIMATSNKHNKIDEVIAELRRKAGTSGTPTTFTQMQDALTDTFDFEVPEDAKIEKPPKVLANSANSDIRRRPKVGDDEQPKKRGKWKRPVFPKGSCTRCPEATDHTTKRCWLNVRDRKGLPPGFQWCLLHTKGIHYEHQCKRHAPNYPPVPTPPISGAIAACQQPTPEQLRDQLLTMLSKAVPLGHTNGITVTNADGTTHTPNADFRKARDVPTNAATNGPQVDQILSNIIGLNPNLRAELQNKLAEAGL